MTLVEVAVATALFTIASLAAAHLLVWATRAFWATGAETTALAAAQMKMEELHSLAWQFDGSGSRVSDLETNLSGRTASGGGPGLAVSPPNALLDSLDGYADYLDSHGQWVGTGPSPPPNAAFVRRWAIRPFVGAPDDTLILQVLVVPIANDRAGRQSAARGAGESWLVSARTRVR